MFNYFNTDGDAAISADEMRKRFLQWSSDGKYRERNTIHELHVHLSSYAMTPGDLAVTTSRDWS